MCLFRTLYTRGKILVPRRILGQCNQVDFANIEHLAMTLKDPEMLDTSTLTNRQKYAHHFLALTIKKKIPWKMVRLVNEVLFWGENEKISAVEIKFIRDQSKRSEIAKFKTLWHS